MSIVHFSLNRSQLVTCTLREVPEQASKRWTGTAESRERGVFLMKDLFTRFAADQSGATAIEYGLIAGLIAV
jgi:hypothetical protein